MTAESRYQTLQADRNAYLDRARDCSLYTIPALVPPAGQGGSAKLKVPYQSVGAEGVNNIASRLLLSLLPPGQSFFRLAVQDTVAEQNGDSEWQTEVNKALAKYERVVSTSIDGSTDRVVVFELLKHLVVAGNVLAYHDLKSGLKVYHLDRYVVRRDPSGNPMEIIAHDKVSPDALPQEIASKIQRDVKEGEGTVEKDVDLFTHVIRKNDQWEVYQECKGTVLSGSKGTYKLDACPWMPLRMIRVDNEHYGRSYVEEHLGDLKSLEGLMQALVEGAAIMSKVVFLVNPNGTTQLATVAKTANGGFAVGNKEDISTFQVEKYHDFQVVQATADAIAQRLSRTFLLVEASTRNAERVTAEEIRLIAQQLESRLGGIYSILTQEFQLPYVRRKIVQLQKENKVPPLPEKAVDLQIITGLEALGRTRDWDALTRYLQAAQALLGPEAIKYINAPVALQQLGTAGGIDTSGLIRSADEIAQADQQGQAQAMIEKLGPNAVNQLGGMARQGMAQAQPTEQPTE